MEPSVSEVANKFEMITDPNHPPGWLSMKEGEQLRSQAECASIPRVLEIGILYGRSSSFILEGLATAFKHRHYELWCVDPWEQEYREIEKAFGLPQVVYWEYMCQHKYQKHIKLLKLMSSEAAPLILNHRYDFAFIDGRHREPFVMHDLILCSQVTNTIFLHDYADDERFDVKQSVDYWVANTRWTIQEQVHRTVKIYGPIFMHSILERENAES